jgi:hypothetical protein
MRAGTILFFALACCAGNSLALSVESDFEGASVKVLEVDADSQTVRFMPAADPCGWYFRVTDLDASKVLRLELRGAGSWSPERAALSTDGKTWRQSDPGHEKDGRMVYEIKPGAASLLVAWGPPYTLARAAEFVHQAASGSANVLEVELCQSRGGRSVPMLLVSEGDRTASQRFGIWVQAWEGGSSWVCQGFAEWILGDEPGAQWLRQNAEIYIVPIMDVDHGFSAGGGKDALLRDPSHDWTDKPQSHEVAAAQKEIVGLVAAGRMDVFLDLHYAAPTDQKAFFREAPSERFTPRSRANWDRFLKLAREEMSPMLDPAKKAVESNDPLWRQTSSNWVMARGNPQTIASCLELPWNTERSTVASHRSTGAALARTVQRYVAGLQHQSE